MSKLSKSVIDTIGGTPLIKLNAAAEGCVADVYVKCEWFNPLASVKDRIAKAMIEAAEADGSLKPGGVVIEPTSGNTGIGLAFVCRAKGYRCILTMPETMSMERRVLLALLGAEVVLTPGPKGMPGAIAKAQELLEQHGEGAFGPGQFDNPANPEVHRQTTGQEIWEATGGAVDIFMAGVGTGGTITGVGEVLKANKPDVQVIAIEPAASPVISGGKPGPHKIQGIGAGFIPKNLNVEVLDEVVTVSNEDAFETARAVSLSDGLAVGISSGATIWAAVQVAKRPENKGKMIVVVAASPSERYLSTPLAEAAREQMTTLETTPV
jgi:cysteine synthase A